jgi:putative transposase
MAGKKINVSTVLAGLRLGIKEVDDGIWLVSFMHYDIGFFDDQANRIEPADNPFAPEKV